MIQTTVIQEQNALAKQIKKQKIKEIDNAVAAAVASAAKLPMKVPIKEKEPITKIILNEEQIKAINLVKMGHNIFLTGVAGSGKSLVINNIVKWGKTTSPKPKVISITATTGVASTHINGCTLHSWAGVGCDMKIPLPSLMKRLNKDKLKRWRQTDILIVDEISMADYTFIEMLDKIAKLVRNSSKPFGGIQLVFSGDFYQLPPVQDTAEPYYLFNHPIWNELIEKNIMLTKVYRQEDKEFVDMLMHIRDNDVSDELERTIQNTVNNNISNEFGIVPTKLFCTRKDVEEMNLTELDKLPGESLSVPSIDYYKDDKMKIVWQQLDKCKFKVGAQVLLLINTYFSDYGVVNGSRGVIIGITKHQT
jgi:ATP-dependent DNA helicase PIF1